MRKNARKGFLLSLFLWAAGVPASDEARSNSALATDMEQKVCAYQVAMRYLGSSPRRLLLSSTEGRVENTELAPGAFPEPEFVPHRRFFGLGVIDRHTGVWFHFNWNRQQIVIGLDDSDHKPYPLYLPMPDEFLAASGSRISHEESYKVLNLLLDTKAYSTFLAPLDREIQDWMQATLEDKRVDPDLKVVARRGLDESLTAIRIETEITVDGRRSIESAGDALYPAAVEMAVGAGQVEMRLILPASGSGRVWVYREPSAVFLHRNADAKSLANTMVNFVPQIKQKGQLQ